MASSYDNAGKIFIGGISPTTTQDTIQKYFEQFGELCDCVLMQDKATGKSRCFGFVTYKDPKLLDDVLSKKHVIDSKEIDCKRAIPRDQQNDSAKDGPYRTKKLFVGGLTQTTTEEQFKSYFEQFGTIEDSVIMIDKETGKSRGFGFITFALEDSVEKVIERYNENKIDGKWVECKKAQAKDIMPQTKKGGKHDSRGPSDHSRHGGRGSSDRSRGQGGSYYQTSPTSGHSGSRKGPRNQSMQDSYGGSYQGGYGQNYGRPNNYGYEGGQSGYGSEYGYGAPSTGYDSGFNRAPTSGYGYNGDYSAGYNANYPNPYQNPYGGGYNAGYPSQYNPSYGQQQSYDPLMMAGSNPSVSNPSMTATTAGGIKGTESSMTSMGQMGMNPTTGQYAGNMTAGYGTEAYGQAGYGYNAMQTDYGGNAGYMGYNPSAQQQSGGQAGVKPQYGGPIQGVQSPSQMSGYPKQGQSDVGPIKGGAKKPGADSRFYQPY